MRQIFQMHRGFAWRQRAIEYFERSNSRPDTSSGIEILYCLHHING